jgi:hypothetical protein
MSAFPVLLLLGLVQADAAPDPASRRPALAARLEELRGLRFKEPPVLRAGTRKEYLQYVLANAKRLYGGDLASAERAFKALKLIPEKLRLDLALTAQAGFGTKVFASGREVLLLDPAAGDEWVLNKMDLALVDQHFAVPAAETYDAQLAFAALRMGDAEVVKHLIRGAGKVPDDAARKCAAEALAWERGDSRLASAVVPRLFVRTGDFAWRRGAGFALEIFLRGGGVRALDDAYARPPATTEQVLHPQKYFDAEPATILDTAPLEAALEAAGRPLRWKTTLGELGAAIFLEGRLPSEDSAKASEGWGGDRLLLGDKDGEAPLLAWLSDWDAESDAREFEAAASRIGDPDLLVRRSGRSVLLTVGAPAELRAELAAAAARCSRR